MLSLTKTIYIYKKKKKLIKAEINKYDMNKSPKISNRTKTEIK